MYYYPRIIRQKFLLKFKFSMMKIMCFNNSRQGAKMVTGLPLKRVQAEYKQPPFS